MKCMLKPPEQNNIWQDLETLNQCYKSDLTHPYPHVLVLYIFQDSRIGSTENQLCIIVLCTIIMHGAHCCPTIYVSPIKNWFRFSRNHE